MCVCVATKSSWKKTKFNNVMNNEKTAPFGYSKIYKKHAYDIQHMATHICSWYFQLASQ